MEPLIQVKELKKYFKVPGGFLHAVDGVNLDIYAGKTLGIVGESGCGKSTLGRLVLRLLEPTAGEVLINGEDILKYNKSKMHEMRKSMQIIFQDPFSSLNPRMSVFDLIAEPLIRNKACANKKEMISRIRILMDKVGLAERFINSYPHEIEIIG